MDHIKAINEAKQRAKFLHSDLVALNIGHSIDLRDETGKVIHFSAYSDAEPGFLINSDGERVTSEPVDEDEDLNVPPFDRRKTKI